MTIKRYALNVLIGFDQWINTWFRGDPDETISSRIGKQKMIHGGNIPFWRYPFLNFIDKMLDRLDPNHSVDAIEKNEGKIYKPL